MLKKIIVIGIVLSAATLGACTKYHKTGQRGELQNYCGDIKRRLYSNHHHRDHRNIKQTAIIDAKLMHDYKHYRCE